MGSFFTTSGKDFTEEYMSTPRESIDNHDMSNSYTESQRKSVVRSTYTMLINPSMTQVHLF